MPRTRQSFTPLKKQRSRSLPWDRTAAKYIGTYLRSQRSQWPRRPECPQRWAAAAAEEEKQNSLMLCTTRKKTSCSSSIWRPRGRTHHALQLPPPEKKSGSLANITQCHKRAARLTLSMGKEDNQNTPSQLIPASQPPTRRQEHTQIYVYVYFYTHIYNYNSNNYVDNFYLINCLNAKSII